MSRAVTHLSNGVRDDIGLSVLSFLADFRCAVEELDPACVINMDETSMTYDQPRGRAFAPKGSKCVPIRTRGKDKNSVTVALSASLRGDMLTPYIIFRGTAHNI